MSGFEECGEKGKLFSTRAAQGPTQSSKNMLLTIFRIFWGGIVCDGKVRLKGGEERIGAKVMRTGEL